MGNYPFEYSGGACNTRERGHLAAVVGGEAITMPATLIEYLSGSTVRTCMHGYTISFVSRTDSHMPWCADKAHMYQLSRAEAYSIQMIYHQIKMIDGYNVSKMMPLASSQIPSCVSFSYRPSGIIWDTALALIHSRYFFLFFKKGKTLGLSNK